MMLGVIPARGGSKRILRKNLRMLAGRPLLQWTIDAAEESRLLDRFLVSTEDKEIADYAAAHGVEVLDRPAELATDEATTVQVLQHVIQTLGADNIVLLQPTSPIRFRNLIDVAIQRFLDAEVDSLATGFISYQYPWGTVENMPQQQMEGFFYDDGNVYVHKPGHLREGKWWGEQRHEMVTPEWYNIELDRTGDFWAAQGIIHEIMR